MKTKTIIIYSYDELSEEAKQKALDYFRYNSNFLEWELDQLKYELANAKDCLIGSSLDPRIQELIKLDILKDIKLTDYCFCDRGEYAKFNYALDELKLFEYLTTGFKHQKLLIYLCTYGFIDLDKSEFFARFSYKEKTNYKHLTKILDQINSELPNLDQELGTYCIKYMNDANDYINSDEYIIDLINDNDYEFLENGDLA